MGHPWPCAAIPASMPGCPLHNACVRPSWLTGPADQKQKRGGLRAELVLGETAFPCGSELARGGVGSACLDAGSIPWLQTPRPPSFPNDPTPVQPTTEPHRPCG